jgi:hypothetical protein
MRRRRTTVAAVAVAVAVGVAAVVGVVIWLTASGSSPRREHAAPPRRPAAALPAPPGQTFGVNVNRLFNDQGTTPAQVAAQLAAVHATGATVARSDAFWEAAEPRAPVAGHHDYDWTFDDGVAGALAAEGLTWLPIIDYTAPWAQSVPGQDHSPPRSDADYAAYAGAFAQR